MQTREQLKKEYEEKLEQLKQEERITNVLPVLPDSFCGATWKAPYITYRKNDEYPGETYTLSEACDAVLVRYAEYLEPVRVAKSACTSIEPFALQKPEYQNAPTSAQGSVMIRLEQYSTTIVFYANVQGQWVHVQIEIQRPWRWSPSIAQEQDWRGHNNGVYVITPKTIGEHYQVKFSSGDRTSPSYHILYLWHTLAEFLEWAQEQRKEDEKERDRLAQHRSNLFSESL